MKGFNFNNTLYLDLKINKVSEQEVNGVGGEGVIVHDNDEEKDIEGNLLTFITVAKEIKFNDLIL